MMATNNDLSICNEQTTLSSLMASSIDSIDGSVVLVMVNGSGQRRSRECYKCVMTTPFANDRCISRSIAPTRSFAFSADRDLFEFYQGSETNRRHYDISEHLFAIDGDKLR
jgi:hypothetical protein